MKKTKNPKLANVGQTFSFLTLKERDVRRDEGGHYRTYWVCECVCGKTIERRDDQIYSGKVMSCGCKHPSKEVGRLSHNWKGHERLSGSYFNEVKTRANKRKTVFDLSVEQAWQQFEIQNGVCALTGVPLSFEEKRCLSHRDEQTASLDRIDSCAGYTANNIQWVHKDVNLMKNHFSMDYFIHTCRLIVEHVGPPPYRDHEHGSGI